MLTMRIDMDDDKEEDKRPLLNWRRMKMLTMRIDMDDDKEEDKRPLLN